VRRSYRYASALTSVAPRLARNSTQSHPVKLTPYLIVLAAVVALGGCYWAKYDKLARTHVALLLAMAQKIEDVTRAAGAPPPAMAEYRYPLERARDFARIAARRFEGRRSLAAFRDLCDAYERVLVAAAAVRDPPTDDLARALGVLRAAGTETLRALDAEGRG
jgi:hypothetical protein